MKTFTFKNYDWLSEQSKSTFDISKNTMVPLWKPINCTYALITHSDSISHYFNRDIEAIICKIEYIRVADSNTEICFRTLSDTNSPLHIIFIYPDANNYICSESIEVIQDKYSKLVDLS